MSQSMRRYDALDLLAPEGFRRPVVTIGVFDGVHRGHRLVLDATVDLARRLGGESGVLTFGTHPRAIIKGKRPRWLTSLDHRLRLLVKPGITCLWQVSGRNDVDFEEWMRLDLEYIDNRSLALDAKVLVKTLPAVCSGRGAY